MFLENRDFIPEQRKDQRGTMETKGNESPVFVKIEESAMAVVLCRGKILMTKELIYGKEKISLPKGHIEKGETRMEAAIRECEEETGIHLDNESFVKELKPFSVDFTDDHDGHVRKTIYPVLFVLQKEKKVFIQEKNVLFAGFVPVEEFFQSASYDNVKGIVREAIGLAVSLK